MEERIQAIVTSDNEITAVMNVKQQMQAVVDRGVTVFVPVTSTTNLGIMKVGEGLLVNNGLVSVNPDIIKIEHISLNGTEILPDNNKNVSINLDKASVGLNNVDNTSDLDKPLSNAAQYALQQKVNIQQNEDAKGKILYVDNDGRVNFKFENTELNNNAFVNVTLNSSTGILQFTKQNGETVNVDFPLEDIVSDGYYDDTTEEIVLKLANGAEIRFSASQLVDIYNGDNADIAVVVDPDTNNKVIKLTSTASTLLNSVTLKANRTVAMGDFAVSTDETGRIITFYAKNVNGEIINDPKVVTLPDSVVSGVYNPQTEQIVLTLNSGNVVQISMTTFLNNIQAQIIDLDNRKVEKSEYFTASDVDALFK